MLVSIATFAAEASFAQISCPNIPAGTYSHQQMIDGWLFEFSAYTPNKPTLDLKEPINWPARPDYSTYKYVVAPTTSTQHSPVCMYMVSAHESISLFYLNGAFRCTDRSTEKDPNFKYCDSNSFTEVQKPE